MLSHVCQVVFYLYAFVVDWAIDVLAEDLHSGAALAVYAFDPEIFVLCFKGLELEEFRDLDLEGFSFAAIAKSFFGSGRAVYACRIDCNELSHQIILVYLGNITIFGMFSSK